MQQQRELRRRPGCETSSNCYLQRQTFALFKQLLEFSVQTILLSFCRADIFMHARESDSETNTNVRWCKVFSSILFRTLLFGDSQSARGLWICYLLAVGESKRAATSFLSLMLLPPVSLLSPWHALPRTAAYTTLTQEALQGHVPAQNAWARFAAHILHQLIFGPIEGSIQISFL